LLEQLAAGDEQAFAAFYHLYYKQLRPFIWKHSPSHEDAEEIMQQTFLRAWLHRDKLPEMENVRAWLFKVAAREYLTHVRNHVTRRLQATSLDREERGIAQPGQPNVENLSLKEINRLIAESVEKLSPQRRIVFQLSRKDQLSTKEIAQQLKLSEKTVKNTLTAALSEVRQNLAAAGYRLSTLYLLFKFFL
jgi:RNA polymerase sigma-70 factor (family 1)